jgi:tetratricopeptide (TPR) repeat protein
MTSIEFYNKGEKSLAKYIETLCKDYLNASLSNFNKAIKLQPDYAEAILKRSTVYGYLREYEKKTSDLAAAIRVFKNKLSNDKENPLLHYQLALAFKKSYNYNLKNYLEKARYHLNEALKFGYTDHVIYFELAGTYGVYPDSNLETALNYYNKAIELCSNVSDYYLARGICYKALKKTDSALMDFTKGLELNDKDIRLYNHRGELFIEQQQWEKATEDYIHLNKLPPIMPHPEIELLKNQSGGPLFEFYFAKDMWQHTHWHPSSYFLVDDIFNAFIKVFKAANENFDYYGPTEYSIDELKAISLDLETMLKNFDTIDDYQIFFDYMVSSKFIYTLIRDFSNYKDNWKDILKALRKITRELIALISEAISKNEKLFLLGI